MTIGILGIFILFSGIASLVLGILQVIAARQLRWLQGESHVRTVAILSLMPLTPLVLIGFPIAIWVLAFSGEKRTRDAFALVRQQTEIPVAPGKVPPKVH